MSSTSLLSQCPPFQAQSATLGGLSGHSYQVGSPGPFSCPKAPSWRPYPPIYLKRPEGRDVRLPPGRGPTRAPPRLNFVESLKSKRVGMRQVQEYLQYRNCACRITVGDAAQTQCGVQPTHPSSGEKLPRGGSEKAQIPGTAQDSACLSLSREGVPSRGHLPATIVKRKPPHHCRSRRNSLRFRPDSPDSGTIYTSHGAEGRGTSGQRCSGFRGGGHVGKVQVQQSILSQLDPRGGGVGEDSQHSWGR